MLSEAKGQCTEGDACSFRHDDSERGKVTQSSSPAPRPQTQNDGKKLFERESPRGRSPSGKRYQKACRHYLKGNCTHAVIIGILSHVNIQKKSDRDAISAKSAHSGTKRLTVSYFNSKTN